MKSDNDSDKEKVYVYIDNFNFYHSIEEWDDVKWLDYKKLIELLLRILKGEKNEYSIEKIKIFTSRTQNGREKIKRQKDYEEAQKYQNKGVVEIEYGRFERRFEKKFKGKSEGRFEGNFEGKDDKVEIFNGIFEGDFEGNFLGRGNKKYVQYKEKETDVNIACHMVGDAYENKYDIILLVSADQDFIPALKWIKEKFKEEYKKEIIIAFPPPPNSNTKNLIPTNTRNYRMKKIADDVINIKKKYLKSCLLPDPVKKENGEIIAECPEKWKWQTENNE